MTRPASQRKAALYLVELGLNDCQIGRILEMPRGTIRDWRRGRVPQGARSLGDCPICDGARLHEAAYAYLLGEYLGDGSISEGARGVFKLRIVCCDDYPGVMAECESAIAAMRPKGAMRVGRVSKIGCTEVYAHWKHWPCLFPQHGPGRKHERPIVLAPWQEDILEAQPGPLLRGLIHSDGWRGINLVTVRGRTYEYPRYQFCSASDDIRAIFCRACDALGVEWKRMNARNIAISKGTEVAKLDEAVGPKY